MYCCDNFEVGCKQKDRIWPNIRIVKITSKFLIENGQGIYITRNGKDIKHIKKSKCAYRYYIGFTIEAFKFSTPEFILINFCPYCGENLYEFYNKDEFVNEMEGVSFKL